ncbi:MAG: Crp/Fnr family transcriptional regulator [Muribaculaceae bacterium]
MAGSMFETIKSLPLFGGISDAQLLEVLGQCKMHFQTVPAGKVVLHAGETCSHLSFVISGIVRATFTSSDGRLSLSQSVKGPDVLFPHYLFGLTTARPATVRSVSEVVMLHVSKNDLLKLLSTNDVALLNFLNTLCGSAQRGFRDVLNSTGSDLRRRLASRVCSLTKPQSFDIVLELNTNVAAEFDTSVEAFTTAFDWLVENKIVSGTPNRMVIKNRAALAELLAT